MVLTPDGTAGLPANWDSATIKADPSILSSVAQAVLASAGNINNDLGDINNSLSSLQLSWTGPSAAVANEFNTRWVNANVALYGTQGDPGAGILNVITAGLAQAATNLAEGEGGVKGMFNTFSQTGTGGASSQAGTGGSDPVVVVSVQPVTDTVTNNVYHTTSVDEIFGGP
jgi:uncharacterized protein YukE